MVIFRFPEFAPLTEKLLPHVHAESGTFVSSRFANRELRIELTTDVRDQDCVVIGSCAPPEEQLVSLLLLCDTLKRSGARRVTLIAPYLAYTRQDKGKSGYSMASAWLGSTVAAAGIDEVVTVDVHSAAVAQLFPVPFVSLSTAKIFAPVLREQFQIETTLVAPDEGAVELCTTVAAGAGITNPIVHLKKERTDGGIRHIELQGSVSRRAVILDDMLDTGGTLVSCCQHLRERGVQEIIIMVTHGLFTGTAWMQLWDIGVQAIYCTDTIPDAHNRADLPITYLSVAPLLAQHLQTPVTAQQTALASPTPFY